jgi:hypothetical protein
MKDEIAIYAEKLRSYWLSQEEISSLKNRAYLEWLRDWAFIQYFEEISFWWENLFAPYEPRTIMKIVERKIEKIHNEWSKLKGGFIEEVIKWVMEIILRLMRKDELSWSQINQLLLHIKKVLSEKYQIHEL